MPRFMRSDGCAFLPRVRQPHGLPRVLKGMSRINQSVARAAHMIRVRASTQAGVGNALRKAYDGQREASLPADLMELLAKLR